MNYIIFGVTGTVGRNVYEELLNNQPNWKPIKLFSNSNSLNHLDANDLVVKISELTQLELEQLLRDLFHENSIDVVFNCVSGVAGFFYSQFCVGRVKHLVIANKESILLGGIEFLDEASKRGTKIWLLDSEHTSMMKLVHHHPLYKKLILTGSGGKYFKHELSDLADVNFEDAIKHPNWKMGPKISIDSATLVNKAFEYIEMSWYFRTTQIDYYVETTSNVHAGIQIDDSRFIWDVYPPSMRTATAYIVGFIQNQPPICECLDNPKFELLKQDFNFAIMNLAITIAQSKSVKLSTQFCLASEMAYKKFRDGKISFLEIIPYIINKTNNEF